MSGNEASTVEQRISALDDGTALKLLAVLARAHRETESASVTADASLREELAAAIEDGPDTPTEPSDGEAARAALMLLYRDDQFAEPIEQLLTGPAPRIMDMRLLGQELAGGALLTVGLLLALQTHVLIERDKDGRWRFKMEKKPTKDSLLTPIIRKLLARWGV